MFGSERSSFQNATLWNFSPPANTEKKELLVKVNAPRETFWDLSKQGDCLPEPTWDLPGAVLLTVKRGLMSRPRTAEAAEWLGLAGKAESTAGSGDRLGLACLGGGSPSPFGPMLSRQSER